jgi:hypothetical protein
MKIYDPDPKLPDYISINKVRLLRRIKWALVAAGLRTIGEIRKTSDANLLSIPRLGQSSLTTGNMVGTEGFELCFAFLLGTSVGYSIRAAIWIRFAGLVHQCEQPIHYCAKAD